MWRLDRQWVYVEKDVKRKYLVGLCWYCFARSFASPCLVLIDWLLGRALFKKNRMLRMGNKRGNFVNFLMNGGKPLMYPVLVIHGIQTFKICPQT